MRRFIGSTVIPVKSLASRGKANCLHGKPGEKRQRLSLVQGGIRKRITCRAGRSNTVKKKRLSKSMSGGIRKHVEIVLPLSKLTDMSTTISFSS